jgi:hypothetical protein
MVDVFMALLSFRGFDTPSLPAQGEQRRSTYFNIGRDNSISYLLAPYQKLGSAVQQGLYLLMLLLTISEKNYR